MKNIRHLGSNGAAKLTLLQQTNKVEKQLTFVILESQEKAGSFYAHVFSSTGVLKESAFFKEWDLAVRFCESLCHAVDKGE